jgi:hypothetical protein
MKQELIMLCLKKLLKLLCFWIREHKKKGDDK